MNDNVNGVYVPDFSRFHENRVKFPGEELLKYPGEWVAFNLEGTQILAHGMDMLEVREAMKTSGLNPSDVVWEHMDPANVDSML